MSLSVITERSTERRAPERRMSVAAWAVLSEEEPGELVDGRLVEEEVASGAHELVAGWVMRVAGNWVDPLGGFVFGSELKYAVTGDRGRKPDVSVFFAGSRLPPTFGVVESPPDIAVEVVSPSPKDERRDRVEKFDEYAAFGVRWYWIIDPRIRSFEIFERGEDGRYVRALGATDGVVERVPGCEGLTLDLGGLWSRLDRLAPGRPGPLPAPTAEPKSE